MRIIAGQFGGRKIKTPDTKLIRPTTEKVRGGIFSSLQSKLDFAECLAIDCYAGSGAMGFEALSRGCLAAAFIELERTHVAVIRENVTSLAVSHQVQVLNAKVSAETLRRLRLERGLKCLFLIDPPYTAHPEGEIFSVLEAGGFWVEGTVIVLGFPHRISERVVTSLQARQCSEYYVKNYGDTDILLIYL